MKQTFQKWLPSKPQASDNEEALLTKKTRGRSPFWILVEKEFSDHFRSYRSLILFGLIALTCLASIYTSVKSIRSASPSDLQKGFIFLKLFTAYSGPIPPFITFVGFLGPLLGIALGFDAVNSERNKGTLSRLMSQPIPRDYVINTKFVGALLFVTVLFASLGFLVMGIGILATGIPPSFESFLRVCCFIVLSIVYVAFWLNLAILFSVRFKQAATSALSGLAVWLFFSVFYSMILSLIGSGLEPKNQNDVQAMLHFSSFMHALSAISPTELFNEATSTLLTPSIRTLGPLTMSQVYGAIPNPLSLGQSLLIVWPQLTGLIAATLICFGLAYVAFMRQEIRSRS